MSRKSFSVGILSFCLVLVCSPVTLAAFPWATEINRAGWTVAADSQQPGNEATRIFDGNISTFWHTAYNPTNAPLPHTITIDMKKAYVVNGLGYLPRQDGNSNGNIGRHTVSLSTDGNTFTQVAFGTYLNDKTLKTTFFADKTGRYVRLTALTEAQGVNNPWTSAAEVNIYSPDPARDASTFTPPPVTGGQWGTTIDMPIVPAAGAVTDLGDVILWSAYRPDLFGGGTGITQTVVWNPSSQVVTQRTVTNTGHDMFCPGISLDARGRILATGGNDNKKASLYDPANSGWTAAAQMQIGRGYQSSVTLSDGRVFTIGGSWSGGEGGKNGEIYDPNANAWSNRTGCSVTPMLTGDAQGVYRADNHAWLFAWKSNSIFQAGPSKAMNWYSVAGATGSFTGAGTRAADPDAMCGNAVMYDAVAGKILAVGGSSSYQNVQATTNAHIITLGAVNQNPGVSKIGNMAYARAFGNGVVLPDGKVFIVGGQSFPVPFTDTNAAFIPELFNPATNTFTKMAPIAVPRTYHSIALLLPDATVLAGGGGLCGTGCVQNHFDAQIFSPPYLFVNGARATRPTINSVSASTVRPGAQITVGTSGAATFSLVRYGSSTHTVNTDQRRVPLSATGSGTSYTITLPNDLGVLVPGYWMLFAIDSRGVPSVAKTILTTT